jgi:ferric-dicitrate binding protein FerR (iron transport regulator)
MPQAVSAHATGERESSMNPTDPREQTRMNRRVLLGAAATASLVPVPGLGAAAGAGSVETVTGEGFAEGTSARRNLAVNAPVYVGDVVGTGVQSRLALRLGASTQVRLGAEARLRLDRYIVDAGGVLELQRGTMLFDGERPRGVAVRSPFALIAVRGTRFFAGPSNNVFGVFVARGRVNVTAAGRQVVLTEGMGTNIAYPGARPTDPAAWGAARVQAALASV